VLDFGLAVAEQSQESPEVQLHAQPESRLGRRLQERLFWFELEEAAEEGGEREEADRDESGRRQLVRSSRVGTEDLEDWSEAAESSGGAVAGVGA
jgi:hypothetical protein